MPDGDGAATGLDVGLEFPSPEAAMFGVRVIVRVGGNTTGSESGGAKADGVGDGDCDVAGKELVGGGVIVVSGGWIVGNAKAEVGEVDDGVCRPDSGVLSGAAEAVNAGPRTAGATVGLKGARGVDCASSVFGVTTEGATTNGAIGGRVSSGSAGLVGCGGAKAGCVRD